MANSLMRVVEDILTKFFLRMKCQNQLCLCLSTLKNLGSVQKWNCPVLPCCHGDLFLFLLQAAALLPGNLGKVFPAVQRNENGTFSSRTSLSHWSTQRKWSSISWICYLQRRTGNSVLFVHLQKWFRAILLTSLLNWQGILP